jgi:nucleotide-binding universal stress UspA family protein
MERVLVGVDGSDPSLKAVDFAADLASKYNAELILLTVVPHLLPEVDPGVEEYARLEHIRAPATELALTTADNVLNNARRKAQAKGVTRISAEPSFGDPAQEIMTAARERQADLIVVGSRGEKETGYLTGTPLLADYLEEGASQLGYSLDPRGSLAPIRINPFFFRAKAERMGARNAGSSEPAQHRVAEIDANRHHVAAEAGDLDILRQRVEADVVAGGSIRVAIAPSAFPRPISSSRAQKTEYCSGTPNSRTARHTRASRRGSAMS